MSTAYIIAGVILATNGWDAHWFRTGFEYETLQACEAGRQIWPLRDGEVVFCMKKDDVL